MTDEIRNRARVLGLDLRDEHLEQFERAIKLDPNFAPAYAGLADAYSLGEGFFFSPSVIPKAKGAVEKALRHANHRVR